MNYNRLKSKEGLKNYLIIKIFIFIVCFITNLIAQSLNEDLRPYGVETSEDTCMARLLWSNMPISFQIFGNQVNVIFNGDVQSKNPLCYYYPGGNDRHTVKLSMYYYWGDASKNIWGPKNGPIIEEFREPGVNYYRKTPWISLCRKMDVICEADIIQIKNPKIKFNPIFNKDENSKKDLKVILKPSADASGGFYGTVKIQEGNWINFESIAYGIHANYPELNISTNTLDFGLDKETLTFEVSNEGGNGLDWKAKKNKDWIEKIEPNHNENQMASDGPVTVTVTVDRSKMDTDECYDTGTITIESNGGNKAITVKIRKAPATPSNLHITNTTGKPHLDWNDAYLADHYTVERKPQTGTFSVIATNITSSEYTDQEVIMMGQGPGTEIFTYRVKAYNEYNDPSDYSNTADTPTEGVSPDGRQIGFDDRIIQSNVPDEYGLSQNYPNPANPSTTIIFQTLRYGHVLLRIFNLQGRLVRTLVDGNIRAGFHKVVWDGKDSSGRSLSSGIYIYRLDVAGKVFVKKLTLMK